MRIGIGEGKVGNATLQDLLGLPSADAADPAEVRFCAPSCASPAVHGSALEEAARISTMRHLAGMLQAAPAEHQDQAAPGGDELQASIHAARRQRLA